MTTIGFFDEKNICEELFLDGNSVYFFVIRGGVHSLKIVSKEGSRARMFRYVDGAEVSVSAETD